MQRIRKIITKIFAVCLSAIVLFSMTGTSVSADYGQPTQVKITTSKLRVKAGQEFKLRASFKPSYADDDALVWSIVSGKKYIRFEDSDYIHDGDDAEFVALKAGTAKVCCKIQGTNKKAYATVVVTGSTKNGGTIRAVGSKNVTIAVGDDFELEVHKSAVVKESNLRWSIANTNIVDFEDYDIYGDEAEFIARKKGTTKITCKNTKTKKKVVYKVKVVGW